MADQISSVFHYVFLLGAILFGPAGAAVVGVSVARAKELVTVKPGAVQGSGGDL
jgi:hypothetical protein